MPRRGKIVRRTVIPDARYDNLNVTRMIGRVMKDGKRSIAEMIVYRAIDIIEERAKTSNNEMLKKPAIEILNRRFAILPRQLKCGRNVSAAQHTRCR